jgi:hypothetical protein
MKKDWNSHIRAKDPNVVSNVIAKFRMRRLSIYQAWNLPKHDVIWPIRFPSWFS